MLGWRPLPLVQELQPDWSIWEVTTLGCSCCWLGDGLLPRPTTSKRPKYIVSGVKLRQSRVRCSVDRHQEDSASFPFGPVSRSLLVARSAVRSVAIVILTHTTEKKGCQNQPWCGRVYALQCRRRRLWRRCRISDLLSKISDLGGARTEHPGYRTYVYNY